MNSFLTIKEIREKLIKKKISPGEVISYYRERLKKYNEKLNCAVEIFEEDKSQDKSCDLNNSLAGIPYLAKDLVCQKGRIASAGSKILSNYKSCYDATIIERLTVAGATSLGRANMDEFAMGGSGETSYYGPSRNPWDTSRTPGGSSSGSAAAVAAGLIPFALGSETGNSIRQPASFCNLVGLRPTYGLNSRYGVIAFSSSLDQVAPLTKTVYDNALVTSAISGQDPKDSTTIKMAPKDYTIGLDGKLPENLTIGIIKDGLDDGIDPQTAQAFENACEQLKKLGAKLKIIDMPSFKHGNIVYFIISRAEAASNMFRYDGSLYGKRSKNSPSLTQMYLSTLKEGLGQEVKTRIIVGNYVLSSKHKEEYYNKAQQIKNMIQYEFDQALKEVDLLISPTTSILPFKLGHYTNNSVAMYLADLLSVANTIIGTPALSIPCGFSREGLPIGFQLIGPKLSESLLYKTGYAFEQSTDYHLKNPTEFK